MKAQTKDYKTHVMKSVSQFLELKLEEFNISKTELVRQLNAQGYPISYPTVNGYITNRNLITGTNLLMLADFFETSTDEILGAYDL